MSWQNILRASRRKSNAAIGPPLFTPLAVDHLRSASSAHHRNRTTFAFWLIGALIKRSAPYHYWSRLASLGKTLQKRNPCLSSSAYKKILVSDACFI
jgi:hypothetical protein